MQPMTQGMTVEPIGHIAVLEIKLSSLTIREAMLEAAVQQLTQESSQHQMEIERLQQLLSPPATVDEDGNPLAVLADLPAIEVTD